MGMMRELQQRMQAAIRDGESPPPLRGSARGLAIYRHAWRARMREALRTNYPVLHRVLGDDGFSILADDYLQAHPSTHRSIRWFGDRLEPFLRSGSVELPHPALADIAAFEWALCEVFDGPDAACLRAEFLATLAPEAWAGLRLSLHPSCRILALEWAVAPVWRALADAPDEVRVDPPEPLAHEVLIWRRDLQPRWRSLEPLEAALLRGIAADADFAGLCHQAGEAIGGERAAVTVLQYVHQWLVDGVLADS